MPVAVAAYFLGLKWQTVAYRARRGILPPITGGSFNRKALRDALARIEMHGGIQIAGRGLDNVDSPLPFVVKLQVVRPGFEREVDARHALVALNLFAAGEDLGQGDLATLGEHDGHPILGWVPTGCRHRLTLHRTDSLAIVLDVARVDGPVELERSTDLLAGLLHLVGHGTLRGHRAEHWSTRLARDSRWTRSLPVFFLELGVEAGRDARIRALLALAVRQHLVDTGEDVLTIATRAGVAPGVVGGVRVGDAAIPLADLGRVTAALGIPRRQIARRLGPDVWPMLEPHVPFLRRRKVPGGEAS